MNKVHCWLQVCNFEDMFSALFLYQQTRWDKQTQQAGN